MGNLPIGQGLSVTPIQMAAAYSAIANGGILRRPSLILDEGGDRVPEPRGHRIISSETAAELRKMLEGVLAPGGTASEVSIPGYTLAGKTGTAQKVVDGTYSDTKFVASFIGFAPAMNPKLLVSVVVDEPQGDYYGGSVAAPAFGEIATYALPHLGIPPDNPQ
jgi:cell division protein FtsI/penicillin-binding protein 2